MARKHLFFAKRLKGLREQAQLTQEELAQRSGLSLSAIRHFEQGLREPTYGTLIKVCRALGVSLAAFELAPPKQRKKQPEE